MFNGYRSEKQEIRLLGAGKRWRVPVSEASAAAQPLASPARSSHCHQAMIGGVAPHTGVEALIGTGPTGSLDPPDPPVGRVFDVPDITGCPADDDHEHARTAWVVRKVGLGQGLLRHVDYIYWRLFAFARMVLKATGRGWLSGLEHPLWIPPNACHLTRFSGFFGPADPDTPQGQEAQIVQSQLDLRDFLRAPRKGAPS